jgi:hypothetical protein
MRRRNYTYNMKEKIKKHFWIDKINNKDWMQKLAVELIGDVIMVVAGLVVGYYMKTMFI